MRALLLALIVPGSVWAQDSPLALAEIQFAPDAAGVALAEMPLPWDMIALSLSLFGDRRDVSFALELPQGGLVGTLAAMRRNSIREQASRIHPDAGQSSIKLAFSDASAPDIGVLQMTPTSQTSAICPWTVETQLDGWDHAISIPAGIERHFPSHPDLEVQFVPHPKVPHSKLLVECEGEAALGAGNAPMGQFCSVFLISSDRPIEPIALPDIRLALAERGKGSSAALLPTELSGTVICEMRLRGPEG